MPAPPVLVSGAPKQSEKLHLHHDVLGENSVFLSLTSALFQSNCLPCGSNLQRDVQSMLSNEKPVGAMKTTARGMRQCHLVMSNPSATSSRLSCCRCAQQWQRAWHRNFAPPCHAERELRRAPGPNWSDPRWDCPPTQGVVGCPLGKVHATRWGACSVSQIEDHASHARLGSVTVAADCRGCGCRAWKGQ